MRNIMESSSQMCNGVYNLSMQQQQILQQQQMHTMIIYRGGRKPVQMPQRCPVVEKKTLYTDDNGMLQEKVELSIAPHGHEQCNAISFKPLGGKSLGYYGYSCEPHGHVFSVLANKFVGADGDRKARLSSHGTRSYNCAECGQLKKGHICTAVKTDTKKRDIVVPPLYAKKRDRSVILLFPPWMLRFPLHLMLRLL